MKNKSKSINLFLLLILLCVPSIYGQEQQTVDNPDYERKEKFIEVYRLHANAYETVFETTVYNLPGWWIKIDAGSFLKGCQTGKTYKLLKSEGFELSQEVTMPDSAHRSFKLFFEPIDAKDKAVHWIENEKDTLFSALCVRNLPRSKGAFACRIQGTILGEKSCVRLLITDPLANYRSNVLRSIPVRNQKFDYTFYADKPMAVELVKWEEIMSGAWYSYPFFIEEGTNTFDILNRNGDLVAHSVTSANQDWAEYTKIINQRRLELGLDSISACINNMSSEDTYSPIAYSLYLRLDSIEEKEELTEEESILRNQIFEKVEQLRKENKLYSSVYYKLANESSRISKLIENEITNCIQKRPSFTGLYFLWSLIYRYTRLNMDDYQLYYDIYRTSFASQWKSHPLGQNIEKMVFAARKIKKGQFYFTYQADDLKGNSVLIDEQIKGKWALIDLWASWCGSCRLRSRRIIPVYQRYKEKGFVVIGIAREQKMKDLEIALHKEKYPWLQLVDLKDKYQIWLKHGIENAGGGLFLINPEGKIAAVDPSVDELERILKLHLDE